MDKKTFFKNRVEAAHNHGTVSLIPGSPRLQESCEEAVRALEMPFRQANIRLKLLPALPPRTIESPLLPQESAEDMVEEAYSLAPSVGARVIVTEQGLSNFWFSHWYSAYNTALISVFQWDKIAPEVSVASFIGYELLLHGLRTVNRVYEPSMLLHQENKGCLFDFCIDKKSILLKLQSGVVCEPCTQGLNRMGLNSLSVRSVFVRVRSLALSAH